MTTAATVTAISSHARLNWKRGSGNQRRVGRRWRRFRVRHDSFDCGRVSSNNAAGSYHSESVATPNNGAASRKPLGVGGAERRRRQRLAVRGR